MSFQDGSIEFTLQMRWLNVKAHFITSFDANIHNKAKQYFILNQSTLVLPNVVTI